MWRKDPTEDIRISLEGNGGDLKEGLTICNRPALVGAPVPNGLKCYEIVAIQNYLVLHTCKLRRPRHDSESVL
jgi:hypothetical protein